MTKSEKSGVPEGEELVQKAAAEVAAFQAEMMADAGAGFEDADASAYAIPFLYVLQSGSPQCKKSDGAYIKGAEEGMLFDTVGKRLFSGETGVVVIPCHYTQRFIEWQPRESGGGFVAEHAPESNILARTCKDAKGRDALPNGNTIADTRNHYVLLIEEDGSATPMLLSMASTQQKKSKQWMAQMNGIKIRNPQTGQFVTAPMMSRMYRITTVPESNEHGSWFGFNINLEGIVTDRSQYAAAKAFQQAVRSGASRARYDNLAEHLAKEPEEQAF